MRNFTKAVSVLFLAASFCMAQEPAPPTPAPKEPATNGQAKNGRPNGPAAPQAAPNEPKPYDQVITKEVTSKKGVFTVHYLKEKGQEKWYFEIPKTELGKDFLWVPQLVSVPNGVDRGGQISGKVIRWERRDNKILLRSPNFGMVADSGDPVSKAVTASNASPILMTFDVAAWGKDDAAVIDVTKIYATDGELGPKRGSVDASRSFVERVSAYPQNIEAEATYTYSGGGSAPAPSPIPGMRPAGNQGGTYIVHYSMVKLPEQPMMPRLADDRVGFFPGTQQTDFAKSTQKVEKRTYIARWRLEKKDPTAAVSEPVKPIVYYVDPATPTKYVPYIKRAIDAWQPAFEKAGFKNAIIAKEAPTPEQDPDWSAEDVRNTIIRWLPSATENAMGPHVSDPRSGEILNGSVTVYHNIINLQRAWYFTQVGPLDPRAQKFPLPDDLMGTLLEYVVKHEVGHTLGLMHNFKASSMYPADKVRDREWVKKMGHIPSIMDYARFNYVAQPEDKIDVADLIPGIGPYDHFAIHWGYAPIASAKTPDDEKPELDKWLRVQDTTPYLRFAGDYSAGGPDPGEQTEAVGDADAVKSTTLGLKNIERVANMLVKATTTEQGETYDDLELMFGRLLGQWSLEMGHVTKIVGGVYITNKHIGQTGNMFAPVPLERQKAAVKFLNDNAFMTPSFMVKPEILSLIEPVGAVSRVGKAQTAVLTSLLNPGRLARMQELTIRNKAAYSPVEMMSDVRNGIFRELSGAGPVKVDVYRSNLQRTYVDFIGNQLQSAKDSTRALFRGDLIALQAKIRAARAADSATRMHLEDLRDRIAKALDPKFAPPAPQQGGMPMRMGVADEMSAAPTTCWPDYVIQ